MSGTFRRLAKAAAVAFAIADLGVAATSALAGPISSPASATLASQVQRVTFWGQPYPYGYAVRPPGKRACYVWRQVDTPEGWRYERVQICGNVLTERY